MVPCGLILFINVTKIFGACEWSGLTERLIVSSTDIGPSKNALCPALKKPFTKFPRNSLVNVKPCRVRASTEYYVAAFSRTLNLFIS